MAKLKFKSNGKWESIAAFQGEPGKDGAIQYAAGEGITIENDTISAEVTKQYVDDAIGGIEIPESDSKLDVHWVEMAGGRWVTSSETGYDYDWHPTTNASTNVEYFKKAIANTKYGSTILFKGYIGGFDEALFYSKYPLKTNWSSYVMHGFGLTQSSSLYYYTLTITVTWDGQVPTFSGVSEVKRYNCTGVKAKNVLVKANTTEYTPTDDYNPATKKYVDDAVANVGGGSEEKISHYYISVSSSTTDPNTNYSVNLSSRTEELIALCTNAHQDIVNGVTPLLHLQLNYKTIANEQRCSYLTMQLDELRPSHIGADVPFVFKRLSKFENAFNDKFILHKLSISYNKSSGQITSASFSCSVSEYATKKYVDDAIAALRAELGGE